MRCSLDLVSQENQLAIGTAFGPTKSWECQFVTFCYGFIRTMRPMPLWPKTGTGPLSLRRSAEKPALRCKTNEFVLCIYIYTYMCVCVHSYTPCMNYTMYDLYIFIYIYIYIYLFIFNYIYIYIYNYIYNYI